MIRFLCAFRAFRSIRSWRSIMTAAAVLAGLMAAASTGFAADYVEAGDSFGNIARPFNAGGYFSGKSDWFYGTMSLLDNTDCLRITLSRQTTITVSPSRPMEITMIQGTRTLGRNFPRFGALTVSLPAGTHLISLRSISASSISYWVNVRAN